MKKQASDQSFHDRRYQERKRAEAAKKLVKKKTVGSGVLQDADRRVCGSSQQEGAAGYCFRFETIVGAFGKLHRSFVARPSLRAGLCSSG